MRNTSKKSTPIDPRRYRNASTFYDYLKLVLDDYQNPQALGELSPLATPYFLGKRLQNAPDAETALGRGQTLCQEIDQTMQSLWGDAPPENGDELLQALTDEEAEQGRGGRYHYLILELTYFNRCFLPAPRNQAEIYDDVLHISRATYNRHLREAIEALCTRFLLRLHPSFRPEQPLLDTPLIGRTQLVEQCLATLQAGKSVTLCGAGGVGKTSLGAAIRQQWTMSAVFWFTIRATLNDQPASFLFALGHFLHQQGASGLWLQLIADRGKIEDLNRTLGLVRADLANLQTMQLLCLDEVDLLRHVDPESEPLKHTQLFELIEGLSKYIPVLAIGQRAVLATDVTHTLNGLSEPEICVWLASLNIRYSAQDVGQICHATEGNPRLIELLIALYRSDGETDQSLADMLTNLPQSPTLSPLWARLQRRRHKDEQDILQSLAVFRTPAPRDAWARPKSQSGESDVKLASTALQRLIEHRLVRVDGEGSIMLLPALREVIYRQLPIELREQLHINAAQIRSALGEYTASAYHYWRGGQPEKAIQLWYPHREQEIHRGQADAALTIFEEISLNHISPKAGKELTLLRSELYRLHAETDKVLQGLAQVEWSIDEEISIDASYMWGDVLMDGGKTDAALHRYAEGVNTVTHLLNKLTHLHFRRGMAYADQRELQPAWREANLARYQSECLQGVLHGLVGNYSVARTHYRIALMIAEDLDDPRTIARVHQFLGNLASRQSDLENGIKHLEQTLVYYEQAGDRIHQEETRSNLAATYVEAGQIERGIEMAKQVLTFFEHMGNAAWIAINATNLSDTYLNLGKLDLAQHYAELCLDQEDPFSYPYALFTLGCVKQRQGMLADAELYFTKSKEIAEQNEDTSLVAHAIRALGEIHLAQHRYAPAHQALGEAHRLFRKLDVPHEVEKTEALIKQIT